MAIKASESRHLASRHLHQGIIKASRHRHHGIGIKTLALRHQLHWLQEMIIKVSILRHWHQFIDIKVSASRYIIKALASKDGHEGISFMAFGTNASASRHHQGIMSSASRHLHQCFSIKALASSRHHHIGIKASGIKAMASRLWYHQRITALTSRLWH